jgi:hypothetical protein
MWVIRDVCESADGQTQGQGDAEGAADAAACGPTVASAFMPISDCTVTPLAMSSPWGLRGPSRAYNLDTSSSAVPNAGPYVDGSRFDTTLERAASRRADTQQRPARGGATMTVDGQHSAPGHVTRREADYAV